MSLVIEEIEGLALYKAIIVGELDETQAELGLDAKATLFDKKYLPVLIETWLEDSNGDEFAGESKKQDQLDSINYNITSNMQAVIEHLITQMSQPKAEKPAKKAAPKEVAPVEEVAPEQKSPAAVKVALKPRNVKSPAKKVAAKEPIEPVAKPAAPAGVVIVKVASPDKTGVNAANEEAKRIVGLLPEDLQKAYREISKLKNQKIVPVGLQPAKEMILNIKAIFADIARVYAKPAPAEKKAAEVKFLSEFIAIDSRAAFGFAMGIENLRNNKQFFYAEDVNKEGADYSQMLDFPELRKTLQARLNDTKAVKYLTEHLIDDKFSSTFFYLPSKEKEWKALADFVESENYARVVEWRKIAPQIRASIVINPDNLNYLMQLTDDQFKLIVASKAQECFLYNPITGNDRDRFLNFAKGLDLSAVSHEQLDSFLHLKADGKTAIDTLKRDNPEFLADALKSGLSVGFLAKFAVAANGKAGVLVESAKVMFAELGADKKFASHNDFLPQLALYRDVKTIAPNCTFTWGEKGKLVITHGEKTYEYNSGKDYSRVMSEILNREPQKPAEGARAYSTQNDDAIIGGKKYGLEVKLYETAIKIGDKTLKIHTKVSTPKGVESEYIQPVYKFASADLAMQFAREMGKSGARRG